MHFNIYLSGNGGIIFSSTDTDIFHLTITTLFFPIISYITKDNKLNIC
jgi:hypothetical protein